jgi:hypothetical protein
MSITPLGINSCGAKKGLLFIIILAQFDWFLRDNDSLVFLFVQKIGVGGTSEFPQHLILTARWFD